ncbi:EamA/RhaT family transporter [Gordonia sp. SL306]|uniref:EamA/RhaT family transporter n=1 Tax=Gordonia sp. SL306 TaxID=2995145 RepID=UPI00226DAA85|nr:EamA/RhaT family transporter [Gordonia sp. SL306]WAC57268.1 EamA/RhaT family transporter [Gordonia sp. SL306]
MFVIGIIAACLAAVAYGMSTVLRALGARRVATAARDEGTEDNQTNAVGGPSLQSTMSTFVDPSFILGTMMVIIGFAGGALAARFLPLFLSQTIVSANLVITALLGTIMLNIALHTRDWIAIWLVVLSLCLLGMSAEHHTGGGESAVFHWELFVATLGLCAIALFGVYRLGKHAAIVGGATAGLLFGMIAIAVRVLDGVAPFHLVTLLTDPAAWTIAVAGAVGFFVQTVALQVGAVNGVTAVLVVGETAGPSLVGVLFLNDTAKPGLGWLAIVGFIGAVIGAVLVAWYGSGDPDHFGEAPPLKGGWRRGRVDSSGADTGEIDTGFYGSDLFGWSSAARSSRRSRSSDDSEGPSEDASH